MALFKKRRNNELAAMENKVVRAFSGVNEDISHLQKWIMHLHTKTEGVHSSHQDHISLTRRDIDKINNWLMHLYSHNQSLQKHVKETTDKVAELHQKNNEILGKLKEIGEKSAKSSGSVRIQSGLSREISGSSGNLKTESRFEENIIRRIRPNRKNYIMREMLKLIDENKYSTKEIEHTIVREKNLCGRTAFYSYLKELNLKGEIEKAELGAKKVLVKSSSRKSGL